MGLQYQCAEKLISMVFERRPIWDFKDPNYHNRENRKELWLEICQELNASLDDVYRRWKSLKDTFVREHKKEKLYGRKNKWIYYESLMFLKDRFKDKERETDDSLPNEHDYYGIEVEAGSEFQLESRTQNGEGEPKTYPQRGSKRLRTKKNAESSQTSAMSSDQSSMVGSSSRSDCEQNDPDYYFMMSLLPFMRNIRPDRKMDVRIKMQQIFFDEQQLQNQLQSCTSTSSNGHHLVQHQTLGTTAGIEGETSLSSYINSFSVDK